MNDQTNGAFSDAAGATRASPRRRTLGLTASALALAVAMAVAIPAAALADGADPAPAVKTAPPKDAAGVDAPSAAAEVSEVVVNGVPFKETVLPTRLSTNSVYGLDLSVMDTPRNTTLLSPTQLSTLNIQDPRAFSYLTASSYSDSSFGTPNIPRIRGQYADVFYNGMRFSFTQNGYGVPPDFDDLDTISITKGPASVIDGPGPGSGGQADFITKRPSLNQWVESASASFDTVSNRRWTLDIGGPIIPGELGVRISYAGEYSDSYFYDHYSHKNSVYGAVRWQPNSQYKLDFNFEVAVGQYTEEVGVNRVSQGLINNNQYATGAPVGELDSYYYGGSPYPIGSTGNPFYPVAPFLTELQLGPTVPINPRVTVDEAPGTITRSTNFNLQLIQSFRLSADTTIEDNAFFAYQDSENQEAYYYADASLGSWTFENRADIKTNFTVPVMGMDLKNEIIFGATFRFAHVNYISDFSTETPSVYDLTTNPSLWYWNNAAQDGPDGIDAFPYTTSFGHTQYGVPGRDSLSLGNDGVSDLFDTAVFFQHRIEFSPQFSALYGGRIDLVQDHSYDPLGGAVCALCYTSIYDQPGVPLPQSHTTGVYGLGNGNISLVYRPRPWISSYVTFDFTQSENSNGGEGGINAFLQVPDHELMRGDSYLYEAGFKFNLLRNKLFMGVAGFDQKRNVPFGPGGNQFTDANIRGVEFEANYQPTRNLFATAGYSYIVTTLNNAPSFYNYPAYGGVQYPASAANPEYTGVFNYIDGAGSLAQFAPGQKFNDPGIPQHVFNFLGNYKFNNGVGFRFGVQVTGPIQTTTSGQLLASSPFVPQTVINNGYYYQSPTIPWQYTMNTAVFYEWSHYILTLSVYNFTNQLNWESAPTFYGNDFLVRSDPRTYELRLQAKF